MRTGPPSPITPARRSYRWWLLFPLHLAGGLAPVVNDVAFRPLGLPFPMAWQMVGIVLTSVVIAWVFRRDAGAGVSADAASPGSTKALGG